MPAIHAHHRLGGGPHIELRIERPGDALDDDHRLLQHDQFGARPHVEQRGDLEQQRQQPAPSRSGRRAGVDRLADRPDRLGEILVAMVGGT